jgi:phage baseplate assembly protein W
MEYEILGTPLTEIEFGATGARSIVQNVKIILSTWEGEVFLNRRFGINTDTIDAPMNVIIARMIADTTLKIESLEPRFKVTAIVPMPSDAGDGKLIPKVLGRIREGVLL